MACQEISRLLNPDLEFAIETVKSAGALIRNYFRGNYQVGQKSKNNPVTTADLAADALLRQAFAERFPEDGWLSEESTDTPDRLARKRVWVVDPLDGTQEFVRGLPEFAISLALVDEMLPRLAVVYNPVRDDLFTAELGRGAFRQDRPIQISSRGDLMGARILGSRSEYSKKLLEPLREWGTLETVGSVAYKLALVAAQEADVTISFRPKNEWDVCAGALLVAEAGGVATNLKGDGLLFNQPQPLVHGILAANPRLHEVVLEWIGPRLESFLRH